MKNRRKLKPISKIKGRPPKLIQEVGKLKKLGVFNLANALGEGISKTTLMRLVANGQVFRVGRNLYLHSESSFPAEDVDYVVACSKFGHDATIGGLTALFHYGLIEQVPRKIWVIVPYDKKTIDSFYICIRTKTNPNIGVENHGRFKITNIERSIVEGFRYSSKIGLRVVIRALRKAIKEKQTTLEKIMRMARSLELENYIEKYWEALIPESQGDQ